MSFGKYCRFCGGGGACAHALSDVRTIPATTIKARIGSSSAGAGPFSGIVCPQGSPMTAKRATRPNILSDGSFGAFVLDQLRELGGVDAKPMFGGAGFYLDGE